MRRALRRRCPVCAIGSPFTGWFRMQPTCPHCRYRYEREDGYWVSAMIVNTAVTVAIFGVFFVAVLAVTLPDVDWVAVLAVATITNVAVPVLFYPLSKTTWVAIDLFFHPLSAADRPVDADAV